MSLENTKVDGSDFTQPISAASLPLPLGAATEAKQTQPGVDIGDVTVNNSSGAGAVNIQDGGNSLTVDGTITAVPSGTQDINLIQINGVAPSVGSGTTNAGTQRVVLPTDQTAIPVTDNSGSLTVDGTVTANQGTANTVGNAWPTKLTDGTDIAAVETLGNVYSATDARLFTINNKTYTNAFELNAATAGADNPAILIRNPNGSGKVMYLFLTTAGVQINNVFITYKIFANPTITTNGTAQTPVSMNVGNGASAASVLINTLPTISANGTVMVAKLMSQNGNPVNLMDDGILALQPNNNLLITANPQSNNRVSAFTLHWAEL